MSVAMVVMASVLLFISVSYLVYKVTLTAAAFMRQGNKTLLETYSRTTPGGTKWRRRVDALTDYFTALNRKRNLGKYVQWLEVWIQKAGDPWRKDAYQVLADSEIIFLEVAVGSFVFLLLVMQSFNPVLPLILGLLAAAWPQYQVISTAQRRLVRINRSLPFALDLMILCMEAGSAFLESIEILVRSDPDDPLAQEFNFVLQSVHYGKTRKDALNNMAERVGSVDLTPVVAAINVGEELGTPIGQVLRVQRDGIRLKRTFRAEKLSGEASSKILFPSLLIMVAVLLMLMGPVIIRGLEQGWF